LPLWSSTSPISAHEAMRWMPMTMGSSTHDLLARLPRAGLETLAGA
jgi:hypothetical protein